MRAVVLVRLPATPENGPADWDPGPLTWMIDRPAVHHLCEFLAKSQVAAVDWVYREPSHAVREVLADGDRWGMPFHHHKILGGVDAFDRVVREIAEDASAQPLLVGRTDRLPTDVLLFETRSDRPTLFVEPQSGDDVRWTGWAVIPSGYELSIRDVVGVDDGRIPFPDADFHPTRQIISLRSLPQFLETIHRLLDTSGTRPIVSDRAHVHPTARIVPPAVVGPDAVLRSGSVVGPYAVVGFRSVIDRNAEITHAVVQPDTFVGNDLRLAHAVADGRRIYHPAEDGGIATLEGVPVGSLSESAIEKLSSTLAGGSTVVAQWLLTRFVRPGSGVQPRPGPRVLREPRPTAESDGEPSL